MTFPEIKLVDAPTATANVLFDFNDVTATPRREVNAEDFTIGVPELIGDVDAVDPLYGSRTVSFTCAMTGTKPQVAAAQSTLARRLLAPGQGWLSFRNTPTSDLLFFRTYRPQPGDLSFDYIQTTSASKAERWELEVNLPCEPFAAGELVTIAAQTVTNDPTSGTNQMRLVLPAISGDAPAPLRLSMVSPTGSPTQFFVHSHAGATTRQIVNVAIGTSDGLTAGADTATGSADTSGVGGSVRTVTFATDTTLTTRLSGTFGSLAPGRYRVMLRAALNGDTTHQFQMRSYTTLPIKSFTGDLSGNFAWYDLGDLELPPRRPVAVADQGGNITPGFSLSISRSGGTGPGTVDLDHIALVPMQFADTAEVRAFSLIENFNYDGTRTRIVDGDAEDTWLITTSTGALHFSTVSPPPDLAGTFIRALPGTSQVVTVFRSVSQGGGLGDDPTATTQVALSYYPRYLYIGDS